MSDANKDGLGARMKSQYEDRTRYMLPRRTWTAIRVDGKAFHTYTRGCDKPKSRVVRSAPLGSHASRTAITGSHGIARAPISDNYAARVMAREFEPTAIRAREIAHARGITLHELAHDLGYADAPPTVRQRPVVGSITRTEVAKRSGYDVSDMSRLFARRHPPTLTKLAKVAAVYGAWMDDMLTALGW